MSIKTQLNISFQVVVLGWMVLWPVAAMSTGGGLETERLAEVTPLFGDGASVAASSHLLEKNSHQSRSQLFQGAVEELKRNPAAADIKECKMITPRAGEVCIRSSKKV